MTPLNPLLGSLAQTPVAQQLAAADRDAQLRRARERQRIADRTDQPIDEYVEGADAVAAIGDDRQHENPPGRKFKRRHQDRSRQEQHGDASPPHIDVRA